MGELSGYVIRYGKDPDSLSETIRIRGANTMEYSVKNLTTGTWFFSIQVKDDEGLVSAPSPKVSKTI